MIVYSDGVLKIHFVIASEAKQSQTKAALLNQIASSLRSSQ